MKMGLFMHGGGALEPRLTIEGQPLFAPTSPPPISSQYDNFPVAFEGTIAVHGNKGRVFSHVLNLTYNKHSFECYNCVCTIKGQVIGVIISYGLLTSDWLLRGAPFNLALPPPRYNWVRHAHTFVSRILSTHLCTWSCAQFGAFPLLLVKSEPGSFT